MGIGGVVVQFKANADQAIRETKKFTRELNDLDGKSKKAGKALKVGLAAGAAAAAAGAIGAAVAFTDFAKAAYSDQQAADKLERTLLRVAGVTEKSAAAAGDWIDTMELMTGIADDDLRVALGRLAVVTGDLTEAQELSLLAADAATGSGKEFTTVYNAMAKAAGGNTTALKRLFPELDAGPDKVLTLKEAVDQLAGSYEGAAKAAEDNDLFGRLGTIWSQVKEALGEAALPTLNELAAWFGDSSNIAKLQLWIDKLGEWSRNVGEDFADKVREFLDYLQSPAGKKQVEDMSAALRGTADALGKVASWADELQKLLDILNRLPGNMILQKLGLIPDFNENDQPAGGRVSVSKDQATALSARTGSDRSPSKSVVVNVINGKQEKSLDSAAMAIRLAKTVGY